MISFPNAKINLGLDIIEKRKDGYHNISSCFYPVPLTDILEVNESGKMIFSQSGIRIPGDEKDNLVIKAYQLLKKDFDLPSVSIHLHKIIPAEAGLGGGSSDAAFMLKMLNTMFELFLDDSLLVEYALSLGSDCPFFIYNTPMLARGRGEDLKELDTILDGSYIYLIKPGRSISTKEAYKGIIPLIPETGIEEILKNHPEGSWNKLLKNDFEYVVLNKLPELKTIKEKLYTHGAYYASVTGSGSAVYGLYENRPEKMSGLPEEYFEWIGDL